MLLAQFVQGNPLDLPPVLYFEMFSRLSYVFRVTNSLPFTDLEAAHLAHAEELTEDWC